MKTSVANRINPVKKTEDKTPPTGKIKLYGDAHNDGVLQLSFTLPVKACEEARVAAQLFCEKMGLINVKVLHMEAIDYEFTFFVVYAVSNIEIDLARISVPKLEHPEYSFDEANDKIKNVIKRKITVIGACIGTDAHTVGIDAIFNMKGYMGNYGLERYSMINAVNMRAQVDTKVLAKKVVELKADAVLVSRVVTQRDSHIVEFKKLLEDLKAENNVPKHLVKICGGPRITHKEAKEIGYDAGFGPGTLPSQVASYIIDELSKRDIKEVAKVVPVEEADDIDLEQEDES